MRESAPPAPFRDPAVSPFSVDSPRIAFVRALHAAACIAGLGLVSCVARTPFLIPPFGATAFLLVAVPEKAPAAPRNVVYGHLIAAASGWVSLLALGVHGQQMSLAS